MCKCTPEIRTPFCGRGDCLPPGFANLSEWLGEQEAAAQMSLDGPVMSDTPLTALPEPNPIGDLREKLMYELRYLHFTSNGNDGQLCGARRGVSIDTCPGACRVIKLAISEIATLTTRAEQAEARVAELTAALEGWQKVAMAGVAHICCEECQNECDHDPGFGFDDDMYTGRAAMEGQR